MGKTGLVVEGGGMKCAYGAGILDKFIDDGISFDYCIGVSAGSANTASFVAGQRGRNIRFYTDYIDDPQYFGARSFLKTGDLFGLEYIYGDLTNAGGRDPIDYDAIMANPAEFEIAATDAETGKPVYFPKEEMIRDNYCHIMASCAIPAACRPVKFGGHVYYDGGVSDSIPAQRAIDSGCERIVFILSKARGFIRKPQKPRLIYSIMCCRYPEIVKDLNSRHIVYNNQRELVFSLEKEGRAFVFAPSDPAEISTFNMKRDTEWQLYDLGIKDYEAVQGDFLAFMGK